MTGFVASAPTSTISISSGAWYPAIDLATARAVLRVDGAVSDARLTECLTLSLSAVEDMLDAWQQQQVALGRATLGDVPAKQINSESRLALLYRRAIYAYAQAELIEHYRNYDATGAMDRRADALDPTADDCRRNVRYAVRDILGRPRADVELI